MIPKNSETELQYIERIRDERIRRDQYMTNPATSPLTREQIQNFTSLEYFNIDPKFRFIAQLRRSVNETEPITLTDGSEREFVKYGTASFDHDGKKYTLDIFANSNLPEFDKPDQLFIPFMDSSSGDSTSENGRYVAVEDNLGNDTIEVDFNRAYNTFSAYNSIHASITAPQRSQRPPTYSVGQRKFEDRL